MPQERYVGIMGATMITVTTRENLKAPEAVLKLRNYLADVEGRFARHLKVYICRFDRETQVEGTCAVSYLSTTPVRAQL